jgi:hypothetical protein
MFERPNYFVPGPPPVGPYEYIIIPAQPQTKWFPDGRPGALGPRQDGFEYANSPQQVMERDCAWRAIPSERKTLIDGRWVYRVELRYLNVFAYDEVSAFIGVKPKIIRFTTTDPTEGIVIVKDWAPGPL